MQDSFGRSISYLRLSVTERCNLRCRYCMPENGIVLKQHSEMLTQEEMVQAVQACADLGVTKVRITGGEPLVKKNVIAICNEVSQVSGINRLSITTNGTMLSQMAGDLKNAGVSTVNISLDTLDPDKYRYITRLGDIGQALAGIETAINTGFEKVKINVVLIGGFNNNEVPALAELTKRWPVDVRFIELMPMVGEFGPQAFVSNEKALEMLPDAELCGTDGVSKTYKLPGSLGKIGFISPVYDSFCSSCNRIRITADGKVKPCLHSKDEFNIKGLNKEQMKAVITEAIQAKPACHDVLSSTNESHAGRTMNRIGG